MGIGSGINSQTLHEIAGQKGNVLAVESFDELAKELGEIKDKVCGRLIDLMHDDVTRTEGSMGSCSHARAQIQDGVQRCQ